MKKEGLLKKAYLKPNKGTKIYFNIYLIQRKALFNTTNLSYFQLINNR